MEPTRDLNIWALADACQRLADFAQELSKNRRRVDPPRIQFVGRLVHRSMEELARPEGEGVAPAAAPAKRRRGGLLGLVLGSDDVPEHEPIPVASIEPAAPSPKHTLALRVHEHLLPTPDLVNFLAAQKKTGLLEVITDIEQFTLEFDDGDIVHAQSNRTPEGQRLGDILVARTAVDRRMLEQVRQASGAQRLGETLVEQDRITKEQLLDALRVQIHWLFQRLFEQPAHRFCFWSGPPLNADSNVRLNATALLLDGARAFDETNWMARLSADGQADPAGTPPAPPAAEPVQAPGAPMGVAGV